MSSISTVTSESIIIQCYCFNYSLILSHKIPIQLLKSVEKPTKKTRKITTNRTPISDHWTPNQYQGATQILCIHYCYFLLIMPLTFLLSRWHNCDYCDYFFTRNVMPRLYYSSQGIQSTVTFDVPCLLWVVGAGLKTALANHNISFCSGQKVSCLLLSNQTRVLTNNGLVSVFWWFPVS